MTLTIARSVVWQDVPGDLALFDATTGCYVALNGSGAAIWREIARGCDESAIADALAATYGVARGEIAGDVAAFVAEGLARGLLQRAPA